MSEDTGLRYRINDRDEITFVNDAWTRFAERNDGDEVASDRIMGRVLWDFISDGVTRQLYQQIVARVRQGRQTQFKLRCDGPSCTRQLEMTIRAVGSDSIEFATQELQVEDRRSMVLLARETPRSTEVLRACSWCNRIEVGAGVWAEIETAVDQLNLFEAASMPQLTHGMCADCFASMSRTLDDMHADA